MGFLHSFLRPIRSAGSSLVARLPFLAKKRFLIPLALIAIGGGGYLAFAQPAAPEFETATVVRQDIVQVVSQTGTVEPAEEVELSFTGAGRIERVYVTEGQTVRRGQLLAVLNSASEYANLLSARARLRQQEATLASAGSSRTRVGSQQDQIVENARLAILTEDIQAYLVAGGSEALNRDHTPPTVSGTYTCEREGTYRIELYRSQAQSGATMIYSGIESGRVSVSTVRPVPLGTCGLFVQFPENFVVSRNGVWEIPVPNTRSDSYQARVSAYEAARENRRLALEDAERTPVLSAQIAEARAAVLAAEASFAETRLVAPFAGVVTLVDAVRGAIASPGIPALSLISSNAFEIKVLIPEDDIGEIAVGDRATVTLDAYDDATFEANVAFIPPTATADSGTASFEVTLQFANVDDRIRAGLSADVDITAAERKNALAVPTRAIIEENGGRYVRVLTSETSYRLTPVSTGLSGTGTIEVTSGLNEGDRIITFANEEALAGLTKEG
jgi:HlyD family secretion protein